MDHSPKRKPQKLLEGNVRENLHDLGMVIDFFFPGHKSTSYPRKEIGTLVFIKIKIFYSSKDTIKKINRQSRNWEKIQYDL